MENCDCEHCKGKSRYWKVGESKGNPSHKTNVGEKYIKGMLQGMAEKNKIKYDILQCNSIPHNASCSIDFVIKKL